MKVAVIATGSMGSAVGRRLVDRGAAVITSLSDRSQASQRRAVEAGIAPVQSDDELAGADIILSIVPPAAALSLAERLAEPLKRAGGHPLFIDCNAINPTTTAQVAATIAATRARFVDGGIIGAPPAPGLRGPTFYLSGDNAAQASCLADFGLAVHVMDAAVGAASALKMSYAGVTKGFTALGAAMMLAAMRAGIGDDLAAELAASQPALHAFLARSVPGMFPKAYRWVAEMTEIAGFVSEDPAAETMYQGAALLYEEFAADVRKGSPTIEALAKFCKAAVSPKGG